MSILLFLLVSFLVVFVVVVVVILFCLGFCFLWFYLFGIWLVVLGFFMFLFCCLVGFCCFFLLVWRSSPFSLASVRRLQ